MSSRILKVYRQLLHYLKIVNLYSFIETDSRTVEDDVLVFHIDYNWFCLFLVCRYNRLYPDPKTIIGHILRPIVAADPLSQPQIHSTLRLGGRLWKVHLQFNWPQKFRVCGQGDDHERAVHYAYLSACHMFTVYKITL